MREEKKGKSRVACRKASMPKILGESRRREDRTIFGTEHNVLMLAVMWLGGGSAALAGSCTRCGGSAVGDGVTERMEQRRDSRQDRKTSGARGNLRATAHRRKHGIWGLTIMLM